MAKEILEFLFSSRTQEVLISSKSLTYLGIGVVFLSLSTPIFAMFQAIGKASVPVKIMAVGVIIKLIGNIILIPIPSLNINGAAISTTVCYIVIFFVSIILLTKYMNIKIKFSSVFVKPLYSAMMCGITARLCYDVLNGFVSDKIALLSSITSGGIIYLILLYLLNYINKAKIKSFF